MQRETLEPAGARWPRPADACGCAPPTSPKDERTTASIEPLVGSETVSDEPAPEPGPTPDDSVPRRTLKVVLTLQPLDDREYRALLAVAADGCDPILRSATVDGLPAALDRVPALLAEAEAHWQARPRNPTVAGPAVGRAAPSRRRANPVDDPSPETTSPVCQSATAPPTGADAPPTPAGPVPPRKRAAGDQLTLFG
ncbi:MAG: hypothetical protein IT306_10240 [Chloroflexi bacterium]|nr:hypothetical protein [Chloroflexota bacterium]